jgi:hypothetical protein
MRIMLSIGLAVFLGAPVSWAGDSLAKVQRDFRDTQMAAYQAGHMPADEDLMDLVDRCYKISDGKSDAKVIEALNMVLSLTQRGGEELQAEWQDALLRLGEEYVDHPELGGVILSLSHLPDSLLEVREEFFAMIEDESGTAEVLGALCYQRADLLMSKDRGETLAKAEVKQMEQLLGQLASDFAKVEDPFGRGSFADVAQGMSFEWNNLRVGHKIPDLSGVDMDGVPFKLSDYAGKVMFLDFWAFW